MASFTVENYLKALYSLSRNSTAGVSTNALADHLGTKAATVTDMLKKLNTSKLVNYKKYQATTLTIEGKKKEDEKTNYVHQGIANRSFKKVWHIEDHTEVIGAELEHGLLKVSLEKIVPEELKAKKIKINKKNERRSSKELLQEGAS